MVSADEAVVLNVFINDQEIGELFLMKTSGDDILMKREDMSRTSLKKGIGSDRMIAGENYVSLKSIPGAVFTIDEKAASLKLQVPPSLFSEQSLDISYGKPYEVIYSKDNSAFLNYGLTVGSEEPTFDLSSELGVSIGDYLFLNTLDYQKGSETDKLTRLLTSVTTDDRKTLRSTTYGDFPAVSGVLGSGIIVGGINISKNYSINPYFIRYPSLSLSGVVSTPSVVEVYINGLPVRKEKLAPGDFQLNNVPAYVGLGNAEVVIRDAFGMEKAITKTFYYSDKLLEKGLQEYSYSVGFRREDFGTKSFSYDGPVILAFHNYGLSEQFKGGYATEISKDLINAGPTASFLLSNFGVMDAALAFSDSEGKWGLGAFLDYSFLSKYFNAQLSLRHFSPDFSNLDIKPEDNKPSLDIGAGIGVVIPRLGTISADFLWTSMHSGPDRYRDALSFTKILGRNVTLFVTASRTDDGTETRNEIFTGLNIFFDNGLSSNISYLHSRDEDSASANIQKSLPLGTGFGFNLSAQQADGDTNTFDDVRYQNDYGVYGLSYSRISGSERYAATAAGGVGYIDGSFFLSRPIEDGFAKVNLDGLDGVRVYYFGNEVGKTDNRGNLIIPVMRSYLDNRISIEDKDIPVNYSLPALAKYISLPLRGGALIKFDITKIQAVSGIIMIRENGREITPQSGGILVDLKDKTIRGLIGKGGEFYLENVPAGTHRAKVTVNGNECSFDITIPETDGVWVNLGTIRCEAPESKGLL
jgi:outer membrane usher protein FimD/PapC